MGKIQEIFEMTIEQYLEKYDSYIRGLIYKRADSDYRDDAYQEVVMAIIQYKDKLDSLETDEARCAYICQIAKCTANPSKRQKQKLKTYGDFTGSDDDATDPEEWFLEDDTYRPDNQPDLAKREWAEDIIDANETLKMLKKCVNKVKRGCRGGHQNTYLGYRLYRILNRDRHLEQCAKWRAENVERKKQHAKEYHQKNRTRNLERNRKWREEHKEYLKEYRQRKKEQKNEQLGHIK